MNSKLEQEKLTETIIGAAIEVHKELGPGLLESSYDAALAQELSLRGLHFARQKDMPVNYKGGLLEVGYRLDFLIEDRVIVELKAVEKLHPIHEAQLITYLKHSNKRIGLLINFNVMLLKDGITRRVV